MVNSNKKFDEKMDIYLLTLTEQIKKKSISFISRWNYFLW